MIPGSNAQNLWKSDHKISALTNSLSWEVNFTSVTFPQFIYTKSDNLNFILLKITLREKMDLLSVKEFCVSRSG